MEGSAELLQPPVIRGKRRWWDAGPADSLDGNVPGGGTAAKKLSSMALLEVNLNVEIYMKFSNSFWGNKKYFPALYLKLTQCCMSITCE